MKFGYFFFLLGFVLPVGAVDSSPNQSYSHSSESLGKAHLEKPDGIVNIESSHSVDQTLNRLTDLLQKKGITLFTVIDHSGEAEKVGLKMPPTKLLIFGNPKGGTPLMLAAPSIAIDLPLKILVWEDKQGKIWLSYNGSEYLKKRHNLPQDLVKNIDVVGTIADEAAK